MKLILKKKPKGVRIIEGFPGFGLIGTIAIEFLMEHLETEKIGTVEMDEEVPAMIAIHQNKVIEPISIHYNKKYNLVLVHAINIGKKQGWKLCDVMVDLANQLSAKEIISLEGVGSPNPGNKVFFYSTTNGEVSKKLLAIASPLSEGIIVGVTGALLAKDFATPVVALFAEAKSGMPDSKAAAEILKALDAYTGLKVDTKPLLKQAEEFEQKLKGIVQKSKQAEETQEDKHLSYVG